MSMATCSAAIPMALLSLIAIGSSESARAQDDERGIEVAIHGSSFFGGDSGPVVVNAPIHPETMYEDTFGTGFGITAAYFRQFSTIWRWQIGLVHQNWPGELFEGGHFQPGWEFGAAGRFGDLTLTGVYGGVTVIRRPGTKIRPYASMDLAIVNMAKVNVTVDGTSQPYWESTIKDFLLMKAGIAFEVSEAAQISVYTGFSVLGAPESVDIISSGTAGSASIFGASVSYIFQ